MKIEISPNEMVRIELADTDGYFTVCYGTSHVSVFADMPDVFGRQGVIYQEPWGEALGEQDKAPGYEGQCAVCLVWVVPDTVATRIQVEDNPDFMQEDAMTRLPRLICTACRDKICL